MLKLLYLDKIFPLIILQFKDDKIFSGQLNTYGKIFRFAIFEKDYFAEVVNKDKNAIKIDYARLNSVIKTLTKGQIRFFTNEDELMIAHGKGVIGIGTDELTEGEVKQGLIFGMDKGTPIIKPDTEKIRLDTSIKLDKSELVNALKTRNFLAWIILYLFYQSAVVSLVSSIEYIGDYVLPPNTSTLLIFVGYLVGALLTIPLWLRFAKRVQSNQRMLMLTACVMIIALLPMTFANELLEFSAFAFIMGIGFGGYWMLMNPALADVIDEIVVITGRRNDGIFMGFRAFFGRLAIAIQALIFLFVHDLTGFVPKAEQTETALFGIHLQTHGKR